MRLEAFKLGCRILRDPNVALQEVDGNETAGWFSLMNLEWTPDGVFAKDVYIYAP